MFLNIKSNQNAEKITKIIPISKRQRKVIGKTKRHTQIYIEREKGRK